MQKVSSTNKPLITIRTAEDGLFDVHLFEIESYERTKNNKELIQKYREYLDFKLSSFRNNPANQVWVSTNDTNITTLFDFIVLASFDDRMTHEEANDLLQRMIL